VGPGRERRARASAGRRRWAEAGQAAAAPGGAWRGSGRRGRLGPSAGERRRAGRATADVAAHAHGRQWLGRCVSARGRQAAQQRQLSKRAERRSARGRCWRASASAGAVGTWAAPSEWCERVRGDARKLEVYAGVG
jgi:hypothetical protein